MAPGPLSDYRIIDLTNQYGILGPRILAGLGAEVIRIEPPGGDPLRRWGGPAHHADPAGDEGTTLYWRHMNAGKMSVTVDLETEEGRELFWSLLEVSDALFESGHREVLEQFGFTWDEIHQRCPRLVYTTLSTFGREGPRADWKGGDLIAMASGGLMYLCGDRDRAPVRPTVEQGSAQVGIQGMVGTLVALRARKIGAPGQMVDVSMQEAISNTLGNSQQSFVMDGVINKRSGGGRATGEQGARLIWACKDGYIAWGRMPRNMPLLHEWMVAEGFDPQFDGDEWAQKAVVGPDAPSAEEVAALDARIEAFFAQHEKMYLYETGQRRGAQVCPVSTVVDLVNNAQLLHRGFFHEITEPDLGATVTAPGAPFKMSASEWRGDAPSPTIGQHQDDVAAIIARQ